MSNRRDYHEGTEIDTTLTIKPKDFSRDPGFVGTMTYNELNDYIDLLRLQGSDELKLFLIEKHRRICKSICSFYSYTHRCLTFIKKNKRRDWE